MFKYHGIDAYLVFGFQTSPTRLTAIRPYDTMVFCATCTFDTFLILDLFYIWFFFHNFFECLMLRVLLEILLF